MHYIATRTGEHHQHGTKGPSVLTALCVCPWALGPWERGEREVWGGSLSAATAASAQPQQQHPSTICSCPILLTLPTVFVLFLIRFAGQNSRGFSNLHFADLRWVKSFKCLELNLLEDPNMATRHKCRLTPFKNGTCGSR